MHIKRAAIGGVLWLAVFSFLGCGRDLPFEYRYLSANVVRITYLEKVYELNRFGKKPNVPFDYAFEPDGDLDITIAGKTYDIDSPYDMDKPKKKTVSKKKKTTRKRKNK